MHLANGQGWALVTGQPCLSAELTQASHPHYLRISVLKLELKYTHFRWSVYQKSDILFKCQTRSQFPISLTGKSYIQIQILSLLKHKGKTSIKMTAIIMRSKRWAIFSCCMLTLTASYTYPKEHGLKTCHPHLSKMAFKNLDMVTPQLDDNGERPPRNADLI